MASLSIMAKPSTENKFQVRTAPPLVSEIRNLVGDMVNRKLKFRGRNVGIESVVGAVMLAFIARPRDEQEEFLREMIPRLEKLFEVESLAAVGLSTDDLPGVAASKPVRVIGAESANPPKIKRGRRA